MEINKKDIIAYILEIVEVSKDAGKAILEIYDKEDLGVQSKSDESPLTLADLASNKVLCEGLQRIAPHIPIISEENESISFEDRKDWGYCWIIDPLDGTKEFIKRNGEFTTNVALVHNNKVVAGVVYIPVLDEMYYAIKGEGAFLISNGESTKLAAKEYEASSVGVRIVCSRSHLNDATKKIVDGFNEPVLIAKGSSLKFLSIAKGEADYYPRMAPTMEWDTCAAQIILEEAGGSVNIELSDNPVVYNKESLLNPHFVAKGRVISST